MWPQRRPTTEYIPWPDADSEPPSTPMWVRCLAIMTFDDYMRYVLHQPPYGWESIPGTNLMYSKAMDKLWCRVDDTERICYSTGVYIVNKDRVVMRTQAEIAARCPQPAKAQQALAEWRGASWRSRLSEVLEWLW